MTQEMQLFATHINNLRPIAAGDPLDAFETTVVLADSADTHVTVALKMQHAAMMRIVEAGWNDLERATIEDCIEALEAIPLDPETVGGLLKASEVLRVLLADSITVKNGSERQ